jgi:hypothetical protein
MLVPLHFYFTLFLQSLFKFRVVHVFVFVYDQLCDLLVDEHDTIRREYWRYRARSLGIKYGIPVGDGDQANSSSSQATGVAAS